MKSFSSLLFVLLSLSCIAQVSEIRSASSSRQSGFGRGGDSYLSGGNFMGDFAFSFLFSGIVQAQRQSLRKKDDIPGLMSFDLMLQTGIQPSSYYIIHPRIRANWGLFSTDFRINYLIEEGIEGTETLRTNDWQILQFNLVNSRGATFRVGGGFLQEAFNDRIAFFEWSAAFQYQPPLRKLGAFAEYRGSEPRKEISAHAQYRLFDRKWIHSFATAGVVYQRYYYAITTWGLQTGLIFRFY